MKYFFLIIASALNIVPLISQDTLECFKELEKENIVYPMDGGCATCMMELKWVLGYIERNKFKGKLIIVPTRNLSDSDRSYILELYESAVICQNSLLGGTEKGKIFIINKKAEQVKSINIGG